MILGQTSLLPSGGGTCPHLTSGRYISVGSNTAWNLSSTTDDLTIECWVKLDDPTAATLQVIADNTNIATSGGQWVLYWDNRNVGAGTVNNLRFRYNDGTTLLDWSGTTPRDALAAGGHLVAVVKSTTAEIWWNGSLAVSATKGSGSVNGAAGLLAWGSRNDGTGFKLTGYLDECAIYPTALSSTRIAAHYNAASAAVTHSGAAS